MSDNPDDPPEIPSPYDQRDGEVQREQTETIAIVPWPPGETDLHLYLAPCTDGRWYTWGENCDPGTHDAFDAIYDYVDGGAYFPSREEALAEAHRWLGELEPAGDDAQKAVNRQRFFDLTGAQYVRLVEGGGRLPVNPLYVGNTPPETANIASRIASLVCGFGPQMGPNQEDAIRQAYTALADPDFTALVAGLQAAGSTGVAVSVLSKIVDLGIFAEAADAQPYEEWISRSVVIDFKPLDNDTRALVVAFILNFFIERLNRNLSIRNGVQPLQMVLFVDEAHNIVPKDNKARLLEKLAREGRSWGFPLWLASQDADKFLSTGVDFAALASAGIHFSPQTLTAKEQKQILGGVIPKQLEKGEAALRLGGKLTTGAARQFHRDGGK